MPSINRFHIREVSIVSKAETIIKRKLSEKSNQSEILKINEIPIKEKVVADIRRFKKHNDKLMKQVKHRLVSSSYLTAERKGVSKI